LTNCNLEGKKTGSVLRNSVYCPFASCPRSGLCSLLFSALVCSVSPAQFVRTEHPVSATEARLGMSGAESGRVGALGISVRQGYLAGFGRINRQGGVAGRKIRLIDYDDHYQVPDAVANTERLINLDRAFALVGYLGTSTSAPVLSMITGARIMLFAPTSGSLHLREPPSRLVFNLRASYLDEARVLVKHLVEDAGVRRIALVDRRDEDGDAARQALDMSLAEHSLNLVSQAGYLRNTLEAQEVFEQIAAGRPEAVILFGTYAPCAQFVDYARQHGGRPWHFCCMSTVGVEEVQRLLGTRAEGIVSSQVVPSPVDLSLELVQDYQSDMDALGYRNFDHMSLEAYVAARVFVAALQRATPALTEEALANALLTGTFSYGPLTFGFDQNFRQRNHRVFLTQVSHGKLVPTEQIGPLAP